MGKKTKKTRWRTLSIGESDTESAANIKETPRNQSKYGRANTTNGFWYNGNQKYHSNQSTPIKYQGENVVKRFDRHERHEKSEKWNGHYTRSSHQETSKSTTRSSSTVSENKIKFNEDEYTRITTPRQDVLFKKGYLSKPKPYLQQQQLQQQCSLTSTGNSTGDGTPDHQSADGNDVIDGDYEQSPFMFPSNSNFGMDGMFFVNGFEPYAVPPHHVLLYDQYGHTVVCLPPPQVPPPPPPPTTTTTTLQEQEQNEEATSTDVETTKRYQDPDSMTESIHNEDATSTTTNEAEGEGEADVENKESTTIRRKKRRRKKTEDISSDELSSLSGDEHQLEENQDEVSSNCKYRVDAEEFVPRCYRQQPQQLEYVQLPVGMPLFVPAMYPLTNHQIYFNNPHHFNETPTTTSTTTTTTTIEASTNGIDIAKIVSKLEQAAKEQQDTETETGANEEGVNDGANEGVNEVIHEATNVTIDEQLKTETNKTEFVPLTTIIQDKPKSKEIKEIQVVATTENIRYSERLKQSNNNKTVQVQQVQQQQKCNNNKQQQQQQQRRICPRLERLERPNNSNKPKVNITPPQPISSSSETNQWIAVSGKKKRGKNKQLLSEEIQPEPEEFVEPQIVVETQPPEPELQPQIQSEQIPEKEIIEVNKPPQNQNQNKKSVTIKKRIIINDELMANNPEVPQIPKTKVTEAKEEIKTVVQQTKNKKKTNKKTKTKNIPISKTNECNNNDKTMPSIVSETSNELDFDANNTENNDDVSLELDRMIQRGLYGNLEERIRSFNPADSFIVDVIKQTQQETTTAVNSAAASVIGSVLKKPSTYFGQTSTASNGFLPPKVIINRSKDTAVKPELLIEDEHLRFPITRAVREWMNKTRENTPEVEIFKKPNEIRQEFQLIVDDINKLDEDVDVGNVEHVEVDLDEMSPPPQIDEADLLDCWEPEMQMAHQQQEHQVCRQRHLSMTHDQHNQEAQQLNIEQGVDVLETYDSVYGRSEDFARIQREVQQQQQHEQRTSNYNLRVGGVGVDGALPYRAICCSIM